MALSASPAWATEFQDYIGPFSKGGEDMVEMERWLNLGSAWSTHTVVYNHL